MQVQKFVILKYVFKRQNWPKVAKTLDFAKAVINMHQSCFQFFLLYYIKKWVTQVYPFVAFYIFMLLNLNQYDSLKPDF